jgi:MarR family transcriptional regulator for hemolysin
MEDQQVESLGILLSDISRIMRKRFDRRARELGLTRAQWRVLSRLRMHQGINQTTLADLIEIEPITLARHIDRLQEKGWVERRSDPNDRRAWLLYLDDSVKPILDDMQKISEWNNAAATRDFGDKECQRFLADLYRVKATLLAAEQVELGAETELEAAPVRRAAQGGRNV